MEYRMKEGRRKGCERDDGKNKVMRDKDKRNEE
jgi:hypothetical protein